MIKIRDKCICAGCTACVAACKQNAISMVADEQGFPYPLVNLNKCINCNLCDAVCPFDKISSEPNFRYAYAVKHKEKRVLEKSTSGGMFTAVSDYVLKQGGVVYGAALDEDLVVRHIRAATVEERDRMRGSKYVQSELGDIFRQVKNDLLANKIVLFTGTPCQIAGLKSFLGKEREGLICLDLICYGVPSPLIFKEHIRLLSEKFRTEIIGYQFRPKNWGWHNYKEIVYGKNKSYYSNPYTDLWTNMYYSRVLMRPSCNNCPFSNLNRTGDLSIGDCQGIDKILPDFGSFEGASLVIVNTSIGQEIFEKIADSISYQPLNIEDVMQPPLFQPGQSNKSSEQFFAIYRNYGYEKAIMHFWGRLYPLKYYIKKWIKRN